jgi:hypothetical protein
MVNVRCEEPFVFRDAAVNVVVMPYNDPTEPERPLSAAGARLSYLLQADTLFSIVKFGSVGAVQMAPGSECKAPEVWAKLLGEKPGARATVKPGHGLVLVWGRLYEEGGSIYVQSYARFTRLGPPEAVTVRIGGNSFTGRLTTQAIAFPPAKLTVEDLGRIEEEFSRAAIVRPSPGAGPGQRFPVGDTDMLGYWVTGTQGDWMRIEAMGPGPSGWVPARMHLGEATLRARLPELAFVEGLVGFLRLRQPAALGARPADTKGLVEAALRGFEQASTGSRAEGAKGSDRELWGIVHLEGPKAQVDLRAAHRQFAEAARLLPQSAEARNLEIISRVAAAFDGGGPAFSARATADELTLALSLDPGNASILRNLASLYRLLGGAMEAVSHPPPTTTLPPVSATPAPSRWTPDLPEADVRRRLEAVDAMLARRAPPR